MFLSDCYSRPAFRRVHIRTFIGANSVDTKDRTNLLYIIAIAIILCKLQPPDSSSAIPTSATRICAAHGWHAYEWRDRRTVIAYRGRYVDLYDEDVLQVDTKTGLEMEHFPLNHYWHAKTGEFNDGIVKNLQINTNGTLLIMEFINRNGPPYLPYHHVVWDLRRGAAIAEDRDIPFQISAGFTSTSTLLRGIDWKDYYPQKDSIVSYDVTTKLMMSNPIPVSKDNPYFGRRVIGLTHNGSLLTIGVSPKRTNKAQGFLLYSVTHTARNSVIQITPLKPLPSGSRYMEIALSRDGKRILWVEQKAGERYDDKIHLSLSFSDVYGNNMRHWQNISSGISGGCRTRSFKWTLDNKHVSFIQDDVLYEMPVPEG